MPITHYTANDALEYLKTKYPSLWASLSTSEPAKDGSGVTEPVGGSFARVEIDSDAVFSTAADSQMANESVVQFPTPTGTWGLIGWIPFYDASTSGNLVAWGVQNPARMIVSGDNAAFPIGNIIIKST